MAVSWLLGEQEWMVRSAMSTLAPIYAVLARGQPNSAGHPSSTYYGRANRPSVHVGKQLPHEIAWANALSSASAGAAAKTCLSFNCPILPSLASACPRFGFHSIFHHIFHPSVMRTIAAVLLVAGLSAAMAACPSQCSGHGVCTDNDVCACYKQKGTTWRQRVGWTGPDCSQRTCSEWPELRAHWPRPKPFLRPAQAPAAQRRASRSPVSLCLRLSLANTRTVHSCSCFQVLAHWA